MDIMTARERVERTFAFQPTDRIARYEIFLPEFAAIWQKKHELPTANLYDYFTQIDIGTVLADQGGPFLSSEHKLESKNGYDFLVDGWGRTLKRRADAYFEEELNVILDDKSKLEMLAFDNPLDQSRYTSIAKYADEISGRFAPVSGVLGLYMGSFRMRGQEQYLMDLAEDPEFCIELAQRLGEFIRLQGLQLAQKTDTFNTAIWVYDEFSSQRGPMFSPATYEKVFMETYKKIFKSWRENGIKNIVLHCDGNCSPLMDLVIETGFNGYQSPAPSAGMHLTELKKKYGRKLVLIGGMCNIHTLSTGSKKDIERQALSLIEAAEDGGVIIGTHSIDKDISVENYEFYDRLMCDNGLKEYL